MSGEVVMVLLNGSLAKIRGLLLEAERSKAVKAKSFLPTRVHDVGLRNTWAAL